MYKTCPKSLIKKTSDKPPTNYIEIDLVKIYDLIPNSKASTILKTLLQNYKINRILLLVNESPDVGVEEEIIDESVKKELIALAKILYENNYERYMEYDDLVFMKYAELHPEHYVIILYDGYEIAYAIVQQ